MVPWAHRPREPASQTIFRYVRPCCRIHSRDQHTGTQTDRCTQTDHATRGMQCGLATHTHIKWTHNWLKIAEKHQNALKECKMQSWLKRNPVIQISFSFSVRHRTKKLTTKLIAAFSVRYSIYITTEMEWCQRIFSSVFIRWLPLYIITEFQITTNPTVSCSKTSP